MSVLFVREGDGSYREALKREILDVALTMDVTDADFPDIVLSSVTVRDALTQLRDSNDAMRVEVATDNHGRGE